MQTGWTRRESVTGNLNCCAACCVYQQARCDAHGVEQELSHPNIRTRLYMHIHGKLMSLVAIRDSCYNFSARLLVYRVCGRG